MTPTTFTRNPLTLDELETLQDLVRKIFLSRQTLRPSHEDLQMVACARLHAWIKEQRKQMPEVGK